MGFWTREECSARWVSLAQATQMPVVSTPQGKLSASVWQDLAGEHVHQAASTCRTPDLLTSGANSPLCPYRPTASTTQAQLQASTGRILLLPAFSTKAA